MRVIKKGLILLSFMLSQQISAQTDTLIYVADPMCSWCYGFAPEITEIKEMYPNMHLMLIMGGLRPFNTEKISEMAEFLEHHWVEIHKRTDQEFSYDILDDSSFIYDTEPAARAVIVARELKPEAELDFFRATQVAFYKLNKHTNDVNTYFPIAEKLGINKEEFVRLFNSEGIKQKTIKDFEMAQKMGVRGFPSLLLKHNGELVMITRGYLKAKHIAATINKELKN